MVSWQPYSLSVCQATAAILNSTVALLSVDLHPRFVGPVRDHQRLGMLVSILFTITSILLVPAFGNAQSIINLLQQLNGLLSMPILPAFVVGLLFRGVAAAAAIAGVAWGVALYGLFSFVRSPRGIVPLHYIDFMVITLATSVLAALAFNRFALGGRPFAALRFFGFSLPRNRATRRLPELVAWHAPGAVLT